MDEIITKKDIKRYFDAWREVRKDKRLSRGDLAIMDTIQDQAYSDVWFSYETFAKRTGMQRRNVINRMQWLEKLGYLTRMIKTNGKKTDTNHYKLRENLQSPFRGQNPEMELLVARVKPASAVECRPLVQANALGNAAECTSASAVECTLMYKDNEQKERETDISPGLRPDDLPRDYDHNNTRGDFDKNTTLSKTVGKQKNPFAPCNLLHIWQVAKDMKIAPEDVFQKHEEVLAAIKAGNSYKQKSTEGLLRLFVKSDIVKKILQPITDPVFEKVMIDGQHPVKQIEFSQLTKATIEKDNFQKIRGLSSQKDLEGKDVARAIEIVIDDYLAAREITFDTSPEKYISWKISNSNANFRSIISEALQSGITIDQLRDHFISNKHLHLYQAIRGLLENISYLS